MSTDTITYAPAYLVNARTEQVTTGNMAKIDIDDVFVYGDTDMITHDERHLVTDVKGGWLTVARQKWSGTTYGGEWTTVVEHKRRRRDLVGQGARRVTDHGAWLRSDWSPRLSYVSSLPGALTLVVIESADASPEDASYGHSSREAAERAGIVVEWQGTGALDGRVHAFAAPAHLVDRLREIAGWFAERGARIVDLGATCTGHVDHSRRADDCRKCGTDRGRHNRAPRLYGPTVEDRDGQPLNPGDLVKRVVIPPAGTGTQHIGEYGTVIFAGDPRGTAVLVVWERTDAGQPSNSYASHVVMVDQVPAVEPVAVEPVAMAGQDADGDSVTMWEGTSATNPGVPAWNCDAINPAGVLIFDSGHAYVACAGCLATHERQGGSVAPLPAGYIVPAECAAAGVMLADEQRVADAERAAGTYKWADRPLPRVALVHTPDGCDDAAEAYAFTQYTDSFRDGDVLHMPTLDLVAVMVGAWPCAVTEANGEGNFHRYLWTADDQSTRYPERFAMARAFATAHGYPLYEDGQDGRGDGGSDQPSDGPAPVGPAADDQGDVTSVDDVIPNGVTVVPVNGTTESEAPAMSTPTATIARETLAALLSYLAAGTPTRHTIEHLSGAVLSIDADGAVSAYSSDYEQWRIARATVVDGTPVTAGRVWLPVHAVSTMVGKWRGMGDQVTIATSTDGAKVTLTCGRGRMNVRTLDAAEMPTVPDMPPAAGASDARTFADVAVRVSAAACRDDTLPMLTHVRMITDGSAFRFAATDRYRFGFGVAPRIGGTDVAPVLVPAGPLASLAKWVKSVLGADGTDTLTVHAAPVDASIGWVAFTFGTYTMILRIGDGTFPNLDALLPDTYTAAADVPAVGDLVAAIARVTTGVAKDAPVLVTFGPDGATVECGDNDNSNAESVPGIAWDGAADAATFTQPAFLVNALKACDGGARLLFTASRKPFVVVPAGGVNFGTLVQPIRREGHTDAPMGANTIHNPLKGDPIMSTPTTRKSSTKTAASKTATRKPAASKTAAPATVEPAPVTVPAPVEPTPVTVPATDGLNPIAETAAADAFAAYTRGEYAAARKLAADVTAAAGDGYLVAGKRPVSVILAAIDAAERRATERQAAEGTATAVVVDAPAPADTDVSGDQDGPTDTDAAGDTIAADAEALDVAADAATVAVLDNTADTAPAAEGARVATDVTGGAASIAWTLAKWTAGTPGYKARRATIRKALMAAGYRVHADGGDSGRECVITIDGGIPADAVRVIIATVEPLMRTLAAASV